MVDAFLELQEIILDKGSSRRALAVASRDIHLENELALNTIYLIELQEGQNAAGGKIWRVRTKRSKSNHFLHKHFRSVEKGSRDNRI